MKCPFLDLINAYTVTGKIYGDSKRKLRFFVHNISASIHFVEYICIQPFYF